MPVSTNVMDLVRILDDEGYGWLAGELLTEISLGRDVTSDPQIASTDGAPPRDAAPQRQPIAEALQLTEAIRILGLRLVEPVRRLADAEKIASELARDMIRRQITVQDGGRSVGDTGIVFVEPENEPAIAIARQDAVGELKLADKLELLLTRVAAEAT